jgi:hypothetical protein
MEVAFYTVSGDKPLGTIRLVGDHLVGDGFGLEDMATSWPGAPDAFMQKYSTWTNGYVYSKTVRD